MNEYLGLEIFFLSLLVVAGLGMAGFAGLVVARLFKGQK
ncbi:hypothetical protein ADIAG_01810 [Paeniglutamicibacter gangotriensis Lz1y]|uniref:Uncharacterized protein n=1 Tax=Paeniglutamicibacter gangotriensis Lz1y TaxID=1276920 RepID=M7MRL8_9MICC|nr:hypothetical protein ADIAG_01810 [Paeniglutamicibacter gangotriensis Lz1y]